MLTWLTGAHGKTLVREAELDRAENSGSGGDSLEEASRGSTRIEVWQDFLHTSEVVCGQLSRFEELCLSVVGLVLLLFIMAPRRRREGRVVVQTSQQEAGDAPPPPLAQPRPQDAHGGVVPPLPPQATQGFDWTTQLVGGSRPEHCQVLLVARGSDAVVAYLYAAAAEADFLQTQVQVGAAQAQPGPSRQLQQQTGSQPDSRVRRRFHRSRRLTEQRQLSVESVQQPGVQPQQQSQHPFSGRCYRCDQLGHMAWDCP
ncbi:hypothetical protein Taro_056989 [Colocasia esculenta]|uniref:CCHC-type domain-containing protein n=1 Tax=Colocasia esculenta TaxID=4460 RepID=A0A843XVD3_COLES|nr:hypothetical protein [Colocasia esculenta]